MRLRYNDFGSRAGACWRQIFLTTLMPWMLKYRVTLEQRSKESLVDQTHEKRIVTQENMDAAAIVNDEMKTAGAGLVGGVNAGAGFATDVARTALVDVPTVAINRTKSAAKLVV